MPWLTLWQALTRFEAGKIVPEIAFRNTAGFIAALCLGIAFHSPAAGVLLGIGALNVAWSDSRDPYLIRGRRMLLSSLLGSVAVTLGALSAHSNGGAVAAAALWAFGSGMLVALGSTAADLGVISLVTLVVFAARPLPVSEAFQSGLLAFAGGVFQTLLSVAPWPLRRYDPERRIVRELYEALGAMAQSPAPGSSAPPLTVQISDARDALDSLRGDHGFEAERLIFLVTQAERIRLSLLNLQRLRRRIARDPCGAEAAAELSGTIDAAALILEEQSPELRLRSGLQKYGPSGSAFFSALLRDAHWQVEALDEQLHATFDAASRPGAREGNAETWRLRFHGRLARLQANLSLHSTVFRHALRLAVCLGVGDALGRAISLQRTYWIPMTIAIVLKPDFTATFSRSVLRIAGTFAGLIVATLLFHWIHTGIATDVALMALFTLLLRGYGPANYGILVTALSAMIVLLIATTGVPPGEVIAARAANTAIGGTLAMVAYAIWPTWERTQVGPALADMIESYREYLRAVIGAYAGGSTAEIDRVRVSGRRARSNAEASVDRVGGEPRRSTVELTTLNGILASSHSFVHAVMALESGLYRTSPAPARAATLDFAGKVDVALAATALALRYGKSIPRGFRDLREAHGEISRSAASPNERYDLVNVETGRIAAALNTLIEQVNAWVKREEPKPGK